MHTLGKARHAFESLTQFINNVSLCSQTQSVNVTGPSSLSPGRARCQTTFLRQLPFLTSAALTWFHLTVVRNLFSFSVMKYYTETPGPALLYVLFVIPRLSLCFEWLWLLFYSLTSHCRVVEMLSNPFTQPPDADVWWSCRLINQICGQVHAYISSVNITRQVNSICRQKKIILISIIVIIETKQKEGAADAVKAAHVSLCLRTEYEWKNSVNHCVCV